MEGDLSSCKKEIGDPPSIKRRSYALSVGLGIYVTAFTTVQLAQAALDESVDSITSDRKFFLAVEGTTTVLNGCTIHTIESDAATIRE